MSAKQMGMVWDIVLPSNQQQVLLALADHAHHDGTEARPSARLIAWKTGQSEATVRRMLKFLRESGLIEVQRGGEGGSGPTVYRLRLERGKKKPPFQSEEQTPIKMTGVAEKPLSPETQTPVIAVTAPPCHSYDRQTVPKPSNEPERAAPEDEPLETDRATPYQVLVDYCELRGLDPAKMSQPFKKKQGAVAKRLLRDFTREQIAGCVYYMAQESWRDRSWDLFTVERQLPVWVLEGEQRSPPNGKITSQTRSARSREAIGNVRQFLEDRELR